MFSSPVKAHRIGRLRRTSVIHTLQASSPQTTGPIKASMGRGNESLFGESGSHDQDCRHAPYMVKTL